MSNIIDPEDKDPILDAAGDLRENELPLKMNDSVKTLMENLSGKPENPLASFVKPKIHIDTTENLDGVFTAEQVVALSKAIEAETRKKIKESVYHANMEGQVLPIGAVPVTDFSNLTMDSVYDLSIPIEAQEFMSADALTILLSDTNYEARWVNKQPQNLSSKIAKGFTYIVPKDLQNGTEEAIKASKDAQGHYVFDDVVAMKIDKATYYAALRAAHLRALATTDEVKARKRATKSANAFMQQSDKYKNAAGEEVNYNPSDFGTATAQRKMVFYDPGIGA